MLHSNIVTKITLELIVALIDICCCSLPARSQPQSCINKRLQCPSLASTLRYPILPKAVSKRKYVGLDEPNFDEDVKKRPNAGQEYDPDGDYIYDARKYFNPEKYREIIANEEEVKKKQEERQPKFFYKPFRSHKRHNRHRLNIDSGRSFINYVDVKKERSSSSASSLLNSEDLFYNIDKTQDDDGRPSSHHKKAKKKSKHSKKHRSHTTDSSRKSAKRKKNDRKRHKKKRKRKKADDKHISSPCRKHSLSTVRHHKELRHRSRHKSKLFSSQEPSASVVNIANCDYSDRYRYLEQNSVGNDRDVSDAFLSDSSVTGSDCHRSPYVDNDAVSDSVGDYRAPDDGVWDEDGSASTEYSDGNEDFSATEDDNNHDHDYFK